MPIKYNITLLVQTFKIFTIMSKSSLFDPLPINITEFVNVLQDIKNFSLVMLVLMATKLFSLEFSFFNFIQKYREHAIIIVTKLDSL